VTSFVAMQNTVAAHQLHDPLHCLVTQNEPPISKQVLAPFSFIQPPPTLSEQLKASLNNILKKGAGNSGRVNRKRQNITERLSRQSCLCGCHVQSCLQSETRNFISFRRLVKKTTKIDHGRFNTLSLKHPQSSFRYSDWTVRDNFRGRGKIFLLLLFNEYGRGGGYSPH